LHVVVPIGYGAIGLAKVRYRRGGGGKPPASAIFFISGQPSVKEFYEV